MLTGKMQLPVYFIAQQYDIELSGNMRYLFQLLAGIASTVGI